MDLAQYVEDLRQQLAVAAEAGGQQAVALAERLTAPLESATRLIILEALSAAADEITRDLAPGSVDVRLRGRNPEFVVTSPPANQLFDDVAEGRSEAATNSNLASPEPALGDVTEGGTSRTTLRIPENLKLRIEEAANREGLSVNAWLIRVVAAALESGDRGRRSGRRSPAGGQRYTGWVR